MRDNFDQIFESYSTHLTIYGARHDSEARAPWAFATLWDELKLRPEPNRTVLVTGSKGKGTVARNVAWNLQTGCSVGLVLSPEECTHLDRIRINNQPIDHATFDRLWCQLKAHEAALMLSAGCGRYLSPTGWFLSLALAWFRERGVDWVVIEGGRGVRYDEVGQLDALLAIVTSVHGEHLKFIGPTISDICEDKLSIARKAKVTLLAQQVVDQADSLGVAIPRKVKIAHAPTEPNASDLPAWLAIARQLAVNAVDVLRPSADFRWYGTPSFAESLFGRVPIWLEPVVHPASLDEAFLRKFAQEGAAVLLGLSDDKEVEGILNRLYASGAHSIAAFSLISPVGHISSNWVAYRPEILSLGALDVVFPDIDATRASLEEVIGKSSCVYVIGVQIFIRTMRSVLGIEIGGPKNGYR